MLELLLLLDGGLRAEERVVDGAPDRGAVLVFVAVDVGVLVVDVVTRTKGSSLNVGCAGQCGKSDGEL